MSFPARLAMRKRHCGEGNYVAEKAGENMVDQATKTSEPAQEPSTTLNYSIQTTPPKK